MDVNSNDRQGESGTHLSEMYLSKLQSSKVHSRRKIIRRIVLLIFAILAPLITLGGIASYFDARDFYNNYENATAKVISTRQALYEGRKGRETSVYRVNYQVVIGHSIQSGELPITPSQYETLKAGDDLPIVYNKTRPYQQDFLGALRHKASFGGLLESLFFGLLGPILFLGILYCLTIRLFCRAPPQSSCNG